MKLSKDVIYRYARYVEEEIGREIGRRISEEFKSSKSSSFSDEASKVIGDVSEIPCEMIDKIEDKMYFIVGDEYSERYLPMYASLKYPPLFFRTGECREELRRIGITSEGVYLVQEGKVIKKVRKPEIKK